MTRLRSVLLSLPSGLGFRLARGLGLNMPRPPMPGAALGAAPIEAVVWVPPDVDDEPPLSTDAGRSDKGLSRRLRVRAPGDVWSDEFRQELRRDRAFEASLVWREAAVLLVIAVVVALRAVFG